MYAVIITGGKQYRVAAGDTLKVEKLPATVGSTVKFDQVLMITNGEQVTVGTPVIPNSSVSAEVIAQDRLDKVRIIKFRRRKHYRKQQGHRQYYTLIKINEIHS